MKLIGEPVNEDQYDPQCRTGPKCLSNGDWGYEPANEGWPCTKEDKCIVGAYCSAGECVGGTPKVLPLITIGCGEGKPTASCQPICNPATGTGTCTPNCVPEFSTTGIIAIVGIVGLFTIYMMFKRKKK
ncbi:hypothetical protein KY311_00080 [Candidatus Woesearchaeota archaeon]|nr:hypothetical protein [Candidatus Woesearchaeota archaeon]